MNNVNIAIFSKLIDEDDLTDVVGSRIYPQTAPAGLTLVYPLIVVKPEASEPVKTHSGNTALLKTTVDIAILSQDSQAGIDVGNILIAALNAQKGTWGGVVVGGCFLEDGSIDTFDLLGEGTNRKLFVWQGTFTIWTQ